MSYKLATGMHVNERPDPDTAGRELARIRDSHGGVLKARDVVDESTPEDAPLHRCFEWDEAEAADRYRVIQAGHIIRAVRIVSESDTGQQKAVRAYVSVTAGDSRGYVTTAKAMSDATWRQQVLDEAMKGLMAWQERYGQLQEMAPVVKAIKQVKTAAVGETGTRYEKAPVPGNRVA